MGTAGALERGIVEHRYNERDNDKMGRTLTGLGAGRVIQGEREEREINSTNCLKKIRVSIFISLLRYTLY